MTLFDLLNRYVFELAFRARLPEAEEVVVCGRLRVEAGWRRPTTRARRARAPTMYHPAASREGLRTTDSGNRSSRVVDQRSLHRRAGVSAGRCHLVHLRTRTGE